jgi:hypothetical protein
MKKIIKNMVEQIFAKSGQLFVYDFDDTLVRTDGVVQVINTNTNDITLLHPHEFHEYHLKNDEKFNLDSFYPITNPILLPHFHHFANKYKTFGSNNVVILTARSSSKEIKEFLSKHNIENVEIVAVGDPDPKGDVSDINANRKFAWLKEKIKTGRYHHLSFFDDNVANINKAKELCVLFPRIDFAIELVVNDI